MIYIYIYIYQYISPKPPIQQTTKICLFVYNLCLVLKERKHTQLQKRKHATSTRAIKTAPKTKRLKPPRADLTPPVELTMLYQRNQTTLFHKFSFIFICPPGGAQHIYIILF